MNTNEKSNALQKLFPTPLTEMINEVCDNMAKELNLRKPFIPMGYLSENTMRGYLAKPLILDTREGCNLFNPLPGQEVYKRAVLPLESEHLHSSTAALIGAEYIMTKFIVISYGNREFLHTKEWGEALEPIEKYLDVRSIYTALLESISTMNDFFIPLTETLANDPRLRFEVLYRLVNENTDIWPWSIYDSYIAAGGLTASGFYRPIMRYRIFSNAVNPYASEGKLVHELFYKMLDRYRLENPNLNNGGCPVKKVIKPYSSSGITRLARVFVNIAEQNYRLIEAEEC